VIYRDFSLESRPVTRSLARNTQHNAMEGRVGTLEQSVHSLIEGQEQLMARMTEVFEMLSNQGKPRREVGESSHGKNHEAGGENSHAEERAAPFAHRHVKLNFPKFNGEEDPTVWVCRAEQFFRFQGTKEEDKTPLASFHLEGEAQLWYQILLREKREITWAEFTEGLFVRFGPNQFYDPFGELTKLQQEGSVKDYQAKFESLLSKIGTLSPAQQVSCFVSGLETSIKAEVLAGRPNNLSSAIGLARVYEARNEALRRTTPSDWRQNNNFQPRPALPIKKLMPEELRERQEKGLCFKCNDKYSPGHRCKRLFMIEACLGEDDDGGIFMGDEEGKESILEQFPP
jgi:hypothetical protein